jgi:hypothetical protein
MHCYNPTELIVVFGPKSLDDKGTMLYVPRYYIFIAP